MQNCKSIVTMVLLSVTSAALYRYGLHYSVLLEMMMSVLREVKGLAKNIYFQ